MNRKKEGCVGAWIRCGQGTRLWMPQSGTSDCPKLDTTPPLSERAGEGRLMCLNIGALIPPVRPDAGTFHFLALSSRTHRAFLGLDPRATFQTHVARGSQTDPRVKPEGRTERVVDRSKGNSPLDGGGRKGVTRVTKPGRVPIADQPCIAAARVHASTSDTIYSVSRNSGPNTLSANSSSAR